MSETITRCRECDSDVDVQDGMCEKCEEDFAWCNVCKSWQSRDDLCRHLFHSVCGIAGSGEYEGDWPHFRESFFALMDLFVLIPKHDAGGSGWTWQDEPLDADLPSAIERRLRGAGFWTFTHGFMFSTPDLDLVENRPDLPRGCGPLAFAHIRGSVAQRWQDEQETLYQAASDGFSWLVTLEAEKTPAANRITADWIAQWRKDRERL